MISRRDRGTVISFMAIKYRTKNRNGGVVRRKLANFTRKRYYNMSGNRSSTVV